MENNNILNSQTKNINDTICAISTPLGHGAISIVRMSGNKSLEIMKKIFSSKSFSYENITPRMLYLGYLQLDKDVKEHCLAVYFKAPNSYTGEDMVEFQIHGGTLLTQKVIEKLLEKGAKNAQNGEFSKRAFENGKISLDMAESIIGEINAQSEGELKASLTIAEGRLSKKINQLQEDLTECLAEIEATLDYPEEDFEDLAKAKIFNVIKKTKENITKFIDNSKNARYLSQGINIAIVGSPNVGKSSTLNSLIGEDKAIVTDIEGTTRDSLTESIEFEGIKLNFIDTAGIRDSQDKVEKLGIEKSKSYIQSADIILFLLDGSRELGNYDKMLKDILREKRNVITIINKSDLPRKLEKQPNEIEISALKEKNIEEIKRKIKKMVINEDIDYNQTIITTNRQLENLMQCNNICHEIEQNKFASMDIVAMLIKKLWNELGKITGKCENEDIIDLIFSKFCLGK